MLKIGIIGSTSYRQRMLDHVKELDIWADTTQQVISVKIPVLDHNPDSLDELDICKSNRKMIEWADEVHIIWDGRSTGTIFDMGMCLALKKKTQIVYINPLSIENLFVQMCERGTV